MVISMEPMLLIPEGQPGAGGYREHDILVVGEDSATDITGFPYGPGPKRHRSLTHSQLHWTAQLAHTMVRSRGYSVRYSKPLSVTTIESPIRPPNSPGNVMPPSTAKVMPAWSRVLSPRLS